MPNKKERLEEAVCNGLLEQFKELGKPISHINGITLDKYFDINGDTVTECYLEDCHEGNFEIAVQVKLPEDSNNPNVYCELPVNLKGKFTVSDYNNKTKQFTVEIENSQLISEPYETK